MTSGRQYVHAAARRRLPALGFRGSGGVFRLDLAPDIWGAIGLNTGTVYKGAVTVQPFISVTHRAIEEEILARGGKDSATSGPTISAHLYEVGPSDDIPILLADGPEGADQAVAVIADQLVSAGIPWMQRMASMKELASGLERYLAGLPAFSRPIAYREIGRIDLALESIERSLLWYGGRSSGDPTAAQFRRFANSLRPELVAALRGRNG